MKELEFLKVINKTLSNPKYLGDDCAYLEDLGIFITQDSLVEDVHFSLKTISAYLLGRKAISVNLSDIAASISKPKYVLISLSLPKHINNGFVQEFYKGVNEICKENDIVVAGGDITGSDKIFISVVAIGKKISEYISSRSFAQPGDIIITTGSFGSSACGLFCLQKNINSTAKIIESHLNPTPRITQGINIAENTTRNIAVMDTSDGLIDALFRISKASKCKITVDFKNVPIDDDIRLVAHQYNLNYQDWVLWGGEDYEIIASVPEETLKKLDKNSFTTIGKVTDQTNNPEVILSTENGEIIITEKVFEEKSFNHFKREI